MCLSASSEVLLLSWCTWAGLLQLSSCSCGCDFEVSSAEVLTACLDSPPLQQSGTVDGDHLGRMLYLGRDPVLSQVLLTEPLGHTRGPVPGALALLMHALFPGSEPD